MIDPYVFVRAVTMGLGVTWTMTGLLRVVRFMRRWKERMGLLRLDDRWWRREITIFVLRTTVLDPINLALLLLLLGLWSVRLVT